MLLSFQKCLDVHFIMGIFNFIKSVTMNTPKPLTINTVLEKELIQLEKLIAEEKLILGLAYTKNTILFPSSNGTYIDAKNLRRSWKRLLQRAEIPYKKFHALRHTFATTLLKNGVEITRTFIHKDNRNISTRIERYECRSNISFK